MDTDVHLGILLCIPHNAEHIAVAGVPEMSVNVY